MRFKLILTLCSIFLHLGANNAKQVNNTLKFAQKNQTMKVSRLEFIQWIADKMKNVCDGTNIFISVAIAQAILETGGYKINHKANNLFGLKAGSGWLGKVYSGTTYEQLPNEKGVIETIGYNGTGKIYPTKQAALKEAPEPTLFKYFDNVEACIKNRFHVLMTSDRYHKVRTATTPEDQCRALKTCGYATAVDYDKELIKIINQYDLKRFDIKGVDSDKLNKPKQEPPDWLKIGNYPY